MQTKLSKQIVYNYIKNFCYSPVYSVAEVQFAYEELSDAPFQFNSDTYYVVGAYVVQDGELYMVIREGSGPWSASSIANTFTNEVYSGETNVADVSQGAYDDSRFQHIELTSEDTVTVYEVVNDRSSAVRMAFAENDYAFDYIRDYISTSDYDITVVQVGNKYTAYWDNHSMDFYEPVRRT